MRNGELSWRHELLAWLRLLRGGSRREWLLRLLRWLLKRRELVRLLPLTRLLRRLLGRLLRRELG